MENPETHAIIEFKECPLCDWDGRTEVLMMGPFTINWTCPDCLETFHSGY